MDFRESFMKKAITAIFFSVFIFGFSGFGFSQEDSALAVKLEALEKQMAKMQQLINYQAEQLGRLEKASTVPVTVNGAPPGSYSSQNFEKDLKGKIGDADTWLKDLKFSGDLKLRYEANNEQHGQLHDRNRFRFRLRFGWEKKWGSELKAGFSLASGPRTYNPSATTSSEETLGPITTANQTFDNNFDYKAINIDRVYATYTPEWAKIGPIEKFEMTGGKFTNPFEEGSSMMRWDRDVRPEGAYQKIQGKLARIGALDLSGTLTVGEMILAEGSGGSHQDAELWAIQGGFLPKITLPGFDQPLEMKNLATWYWFDDYTYSGNYITAGGNPRSGLDLAAGDFKVLEFYNEAALHLPYVKRSAVYFDFAQNLDDNATTKLLGGTQNTAYSIGIKLGELKKKNTWEAIYEYYRIEANATPSGFSDADFGGTNRLGSVVKFSYAFTDYMHIGTAMFLTDRLLKGDPTIANGSNRQTFQIDLNWKF